MLNSLYGKFGMNEIKNKTVIVEKTKAEILIKKYKFSEYEELSENKMLVTYENIQNYKRKVNISISSAIAAYARIQLHEY
jgi:hypothetical protein